MTSFYPYKHCIILKKCLDNSQKRVNNIEPTINGKKCMKIFIKSAIFVLFMGFFVGTAGVALAYSPTMSVSSSGNNTTVYITGGQPYASVVISYMPFGSSLSSTVSGQTDYSGNFTTMVQSANSSQITATVAGQQVYSNNNNNNNYNGCGYYNCGGCTYNCGIGGLSLSQTSLSLTTGQSATVTASYPIYGSSNYYISSNSNSSVASASVSGSQITVYGIVSGSTSISVCVSSGSSVCTNLYVAVSGNGSCSYYGCGSGSLSLSQTSLSMSAGQSSTVTVYNNTYGGTPYISSNSNSAVASASVSGNSVYVTAISSGSANIYICQGGSSQCATLYVTVTGGYYGNGSLYFSPSSLTITSGQSSTVLVYNTTNTYGSYYVSSNSNPSVASASISGSSLYVSGLVGGSTSIVVCQSGYSSSCATLYVTVNGSVLGANTNLWFSPGSASLYVGQSLAVSINSSSYNTSAYPYTSNPYYVSSNSNSGVVSATVSGTVLNLYANQNGTSSIIVCNSALSFCGTLYVTVGGSSSGSGLYLSQTSLNLTVGQTAAITSNNASGLYISSNSNSAVVSANVYANQINLVGLAVGSSTIYVCSTNSQCAYLYVTVGGYYGGSGTVWFSPSSANLTLGQSSTVAISGNYGGSYYISSNSNSSVASASISGSNLYLYANSNGNSTISVCQSSYSSSCGTLYVTVGNGYSNGSLSLSQTTLNIGLNQSTTVNAYGNGSGYYYISSNSNAAVATANISGSVVNIYGLSTGSTTIVVCQSNSNACANIYVSVGSGYYGNNGSLSLSPTSLNISSGQSSNVSIYGNGSYYISSNYNSAVASASISGSTVNIYGSAAGSTTIVICQNNPNSCTNLLVTVGGYSYNPGSSYNTGGLQYEGAPSGSGSSVLGASTYANGELIGEGQAVYMVYKNTKTGFANAAAFTGLGFSFSNVVQVGSSGLASSGYTVSSPRVQHPWGTWIKNSGNTVYFVNDLGLIPVPDWATFLNNGGQSNFIVNANSYDFKLPILSPMVNSDPRLR